MVFMHGCIISNSVIARICKQTRAAFFGAAHFRRDAQLLYDCTEEMLFIEKFEAMNHGLPNQKRGDQNESHCIYI